MFNAIEMWAIVEYFKFEFFNQTRKRRKKIH